jgi:hypothetical protein
MDDTIVNLLKTRTNQTQLEINSGSQTVALVDSAGNIGTPVPVKPLADLYGRGTGLPSVEFVDDRFRPVLLAIEEAISDGYAGHPSLTDAAVISALDRLCMTPEANVQNDGLANSIQFALRVTLSLNNFSRQDVRLCLRKVKQSATRHNKLAGPRGYLDFIRKMLDKSTR